MLLSLLCMTLLLDMPSAARAARARLTMQGGKAEEPTGPPDNDELPERSEEQTVMNKCELAEFGKVSRPGAASLLEPSYEQLEEQGPPGTLVQLTAQEVVDGLWHGNTSVLDLLEHGRAAFDDYRCDEQEFEDFMGKFGLVGDECFGKTNFGRGEICESGNVVWIYPKHDHNGAFCIDESACHRLTLWSSHACSVKVWRVETLEEALQLLSRYPDNSIKHMVLGGHGDGSSIRWGGKHDGILGLVGDEKPVPMGSIVRPTEVVPSMNNMGNRDFMPGAVGYVRWIDRDGDAVIYIDGHTISQHIEAKSFSKLEVSPSGAKSFLLALREKMHKHGSIFTDSCLSATSTRSPNIAQFVAEQDIERRAQQRRAAGGQGRPRHRLRGQLQRGARQEVPCLAWGRRGRAAARLLCPGSRVPFLGPRAETRRGRQLPLPRGVGVQDCGGRSLPQERRDRQRRVLPALLRGGVVRGDVHLRVEAHLLRCVGLHHRALSGQKV